MGLAPNGVRPKIPVVLYIKAAIILPIVARTFTIRTSDPGSNAAFSINGKSVLVNKNGLMWLSPTEKEKNKSSVQVTQGEPRTPAYLMTILSEILSDVLPYSLNILASSI